MLREISQIEKRQVKHNFSNMWDTKLKATNVQEQQTKIHSYRSSIVVTRRKEGRGVLGVKGVKYTVMEEDRTLVLGTQCNIQITYCRNVHMKPT